jgi:hypothetical protein
MAMDNSVFHVLENLFTKANSCNASGATAKTEGCPIARYHEDSRVVNLISEFP